MKKSTCSLSRTGQWTRQHVLLCNAQHITSTKKVVFLVHAKKEYRGGSQVQLQSSWTLALVGDEWSTSRPGRFTLGKNDGIHCIEVCVSHTTGLDVLKKRKSLVPAANRIPNSPGLSVDSTNSANLVPTRAYLHTLRSSYDTVRVKSDYIKEDDLK